MSRVIDYAWGRIPLDDLRKERAVAVCRYHAFSSPSTDGKRLTPVEAAYLTLGGFAIISNWQQAGSRAEISGGFNTGLRHATQAAIDHEYCGGPSTRPIYFSIDWDVLDSQLPVVGDYFRGVASRIGLARTGAYGGYRVVKYLLDQGLIRWAWQTYAWSGGQWDSRAKLRQVQNSVTIGGVDCDRNESMTADFGQWGTGDVVTDLSKPYAADNADAHGYAGTQLQKSYGVHANGVDPGLTTIGNLQALLLLGLETKLSALVALVTQLTTEEPTDVQKILDAIAAVTHIDAHALAGEITASLIADNGNPLDVAHNEAVRAVTLSVVNEVLNRTRLVTE